MSSAPAELSTPPQHLPGQQLSKDDGSVWRRRDLRSLLIFILLNGVVLNLAFFVVNLYLVRVNLGLKSHGTFGPLKAFATGTMGTDSNAVMLSALHRFQQTPSVFLYGVIFFQEHQKFQYPLPSLLPYYVLQAAGASDHTLILISTAISWLSVCGVIMITALIAVHRFPAGRGTKPTAFIALTVAIAGLLFYPLTHSYSLGQIQTLLTFGFAIAFYCWMLGWEKTAGALMGIMTLVKPQYGLFLIWAALRRKWGAFAAGSACLVTGLLSACAVFGVRNNLDYLKVIRTISLHGEGFFNNQSINGLLNRLLSNGNNLIWDADHYAPYNAVVYLGTLLTSLTLVIAALFYRWKDRRAGAADFAAAVLVSTMASPVAWEHHYAILLPVFAWLWFGEYMGAASRSPSWLLALAYIFISNYILPLSAFAQVPVLNILQSCLYFGAVIMLVLLLRSSDEPPVGRLRPATGASF